MFLYRAKSLPTRSWAGAARYFLADQLCHFVPPLALAACFAGQERKKITGVYDTELHVFGSCFVYSVSDLADQRALRTAAFGHYFFQPLFWLRA